MPWTGNQGNDPYEDDAQTYASEFEKQMKTSRSELDVQEQWLSRSPQENVERLNKESAQTGVYGFSYHRGSVQEIPGMTSMVYEIPNDPNGGAYVGYESYQQTYQKAEMAYQAAYDRNHGKAGTEAEQTFASATQRYENQKADYEKYLQENPDAPDYLNPNEMQTKNPVEAYVNYEGPKRTANAFYNQELSEADHDISMSQVQEKMHDGYAGIMQVQTASQEGEYADAYHKQHGTEGLNTDSYAVRVMEGTDADTVNYMKSYPDDGSMPKISGQPGSDEYGETALSRMLAIEEDLALKDANYEKMFPENMKYYREGENPQAIPGMTLVVSKIEGAPGYVAGYESYDATYQDATKQLDKQSEVLLSDTLSEKEKLELQERLDRGYQAAGNLYDQQKLQYDVYAKNHPGNQFLDKKNPVEAFQDFESRMPEDQKRRDTYGSIKELLKDGLEKFKEWGQNIMKTFHAYAPGEYNEAQAMNASAEYWTKRAALEPDNKEFQQRAMEVSRAKAEREGQNQSMSMKDTVVESTDIPYDTMRASNQNREMSEQQLSQVPSGNPFRDIVNQSHMGDSYYQMQNPMRAMPYEPPVYGSTGSTVLDELSRGSTDSVDNMMQQMADTNDLGYDPNLYTGNPEEPTVQKESMRQTQKQAGTHRVDRAAQLAELTAKLERNGAAQQADIGMSFGMRR